MAYTDPTITAYNATPPADDGSQVSTNKVTWTMVKSKLTDPLNTSLTNLVANFRFAGFHSANRTSGTDAVTTTTVAALSDAHTITAEATTENSKIYIIWSIGFNNTVDSGTTTNRQANLKLQAYDGAAWQDITGSGQTVGATFGAASASGNARGTAVLVGTAADSDRQNDTTWQIRVAGAPAAANHTCTTYNYAFWAVEILE